MEWIRKAAEQGHVMAMNWLAQALVNSDGNIEEAVHWLRRAIELGDEKARLFLEHDVRVRDYK